MFVSLSAAAAGSTSITKSRFRSAVREAERVEALWAKLVATRFAGRLAEIQCFRPLETRRDVGAIIAYLKSHPAALISALISITS